MIFGLVVRNLILFYARLAEAVSEAPAWEHLAVRRCNLAYFTAVTPVWPESAPEVEPEIAAVRLQEAQMNAGVRSGSKTDAADRKKKAASMLVFERLLGVMTEGRLRRRSPEKMKRLARRRIRAGPGPAGRDLRRGPAGQGDSEKQVRTPARVAGKIASPRCWARPLQRRCRRPLQRRSAVGLWRAG
jgi:hypothetical protein